MPPTADAATTTDPPLSPRALHPRADGPHGRPRFTHVLLDLDDTLYRHEHVGAMVRANIERYVVDHLNVPHDEAAALTGRLYVSHGTTMAGLAQEGHALDPDHWHERVHAPLAYEELLARDDALIAMLMRLRTEKHVFTNADRKHMDICLRLLGASREQGVVWGSGGVGDDDDDGFFYFENVQRYGAERGLVPDASHPTAGHRGKGFLAKPDPAVFRLVAEKVGAPSPRTCVFVDDSPRNVASARSVGMFTVLVGRRRSEVVPGADLCVETVLELEEVLPELFDGVSGDECGGELAAAAAAVVPIKVVAG